MDYEKIASAFTDKKISFRTATEREITHVLKGLFTKGKRINAQTVESVEKYMNGFFALESLKLNPVDVREIMATSDFEKIAVDDFLDSTSFDMSGESV